MEKRPRASKTTSLACIISAWGKLKAQLTSIKYDHLTETYLVTIQTKDGDTITEVGKEPLERFIQSISTKLIKLQRSNPSRFKKHTAYFDELEKIYPKEK